MQSTPPRQLVKGLLSPVERYSEVLFGVLMALTITGALRVGGAGAQDSRSAFFSALGCNVAWGIVDAVMYGLNALFERGRRILLFHHVRRGSPAAGRRVVAEAMPDGLGEALNEAEIEALRHRIAGWRGIPAQPRILWEDVLAAAGVFLLVVVSTFPVALPFLLVSDVKVAMRISRGLSLALLFLCGYGVGRYSGLRSVRLGLGMLAIGVVLVVLLEALGG